MMTSSNGNILRVTGHLCGEFTGPPQRPVTRNFDVFFDLHLNKRLSKLSRGWWFDVLSCPLWRHSNVRRVWEKTIAAKKYHHGLYSLHILIKFKCTTNKNCYVFSMNKYVSCQMSSSFVVEQKNVPYPAMLVVTVSHRIYCHIYWFGPPYREGY